MEKRGATAFMISHLAEIVLGIIALILLGALVIYLYGDKLVEYANIIIDKRRYG